ncbi:MAG: mechanosensitive ion channel [Vicingus serpentipes]|nr:mechanosensitive ion channel [Vicingus serpentipes]
MEKQALLLYNYLEQLGLSTATSQQLNAALLVVGLIILVAIIDFITRKILLQVFTRFAEKSKTNFDDLMITNRVPRSLSHIIPLVISLKVIPFIFIHYPALENIVDKGLRLFGIVLTLWIVRSLLHTFKDYFKTLPNLKDKPIDSYIQVFMIFSWIAGIVLALALITDTPIWKFFTALGATSAVLILIFKDTIMGFVASIQVSVNDMVRIGDWITFEKFGADGDVIEINLATVKVQNFDNTITTIPTYSLISDSFKNWRGMSNSGGRRIKRALIIKQTSIHFLEPEEVNQLKKIELITKYLVKREQDINNYNSDNNINKELLINGRNLTNIGVFRKYLNEYINSHSAINKEMMIMVRQLAPTSQGIPVEIYAFSSDKKWENYEYIMADVFDHVLAATDFFNLELFELPTNFNQKIINPKKSPSEFSEGE